MRLNGSKFKLLIVSIVILTVSLTINFLLSISSFEDVFRNSVISKYIFINRNLSTKIETALNLGKPLYKFNGIETYFDEILTSESQISNVFISSKNGKIYYSHDESYVNRYIIDDLISNDANEKTKVTRIKDKYYVGSPIYLEGKTIEGYAFIEFNKELINRSVVEMIEESIEIFLYALGVSIFILMLVIKALTFESEKKAAKGNFIAILSLFIVAQIAYSYFNIGYFEKKYIYTLNSNIDNLSKSIETELEYYSKLNLNVSDLKGFDKYLLSELEEVPEASEVYILDISNNMIFSADSKGGTRSIFDSNTLKFEEVKIDKKYNRNYSLLIKTKQVNISINLDEGLIRKKTKELIFDSLTMLIISIVISYHFLLMSSIKKCNFISENCDDENEKVMIQLIAFIFYFAEMMSISFIPLLIEKIYKDNPVQIFNMTKDMIIGLPIAAYMFGSAISVLAVGYASHKISEKKVFIWCSLLLIIGASGAAFSNTIVNLSLFRLLSGIGYGGITINSTSLILRRFKRGQVAIGFGFWASGYGAASICAIPIGGILVFRFGFMTSLLTSASVSAILLLFTTVYINDMKIDKEKIKESELSFKETLNIFTDRNVFSNFFFRLFPFHIVYVGVFQFMMPLFMNEKGISQADIGRILTIFGLVYLLMPIVSKQVARYKNDRLFIAFGSFIIGAFLLILRFSSGITGFVLVISGISLGSMIADAAEESFITSTDKAKEIGEAKFMSIYNSYERFIMVVSPIICSFFITFFGFSRGIFFIGVMIIVCSIIYLIVSKNTVTIKTK